MNITHEDVERVAQLAMLKLSADEIQTMTRQLDTILSYVAKLDELDTSAIEITTHTQSMVNAFRDDVSCPSLPREKALAAAPLQNGETFVVPRVI